MDNDNRGPDRDDQVHYPAEPGDSEVFGCELPDEELPDH